MLLRSTNLDCATLTCILSVLYYNLSIDLKWTGLSEMGAPGTDASVPEKTLELVERMIERHRRYKLLLEERVMTDC